MVSGVEASYLEAQALEEVELDSSRKYSAFHLVILLSHLSSPDRVQGEHMMMTILGV